MTSHIRCVSIMLIPMTAGFLMHAKPPHQPTTPLPSPTSLPALATSAAVLSQVVESSPLQYSDAKTRRREADRIRKACKGPPLRIVIAGKPSSGKGSMSPMISRAFGGVRISSGDLLRSEAQAETELGRVAKEYMSRGEMLPSDLVLSLVTRRLSQRDCLQNGWILDGFPRSREQAMALTQQGIVPDLFIVLDRPDHLVKDFCIGRCTDSLTGSIYHEKFRPPPPEVWHRLIWRNDDTVEIITKRIKQFNETVQGIMQAYSGVPTRIVDTSGFDLDAFEDICDSAMEVARLKEVRLGPQGMRAIRAMGDPRMSDVAELPEEEERHQRMAGEGGKHGEVASEKPTLLAAVQRCNRHDPSHHTPVYLCGVKVGWLPRSFADNLRPFLGREVELLETFPGAGLLGEDGPAYVLAPHAGDVDQRTEVVGRLIRGLAENGAIPEESLGDELQEIRALAGKVSPLGSPLVRLATGAMIYFGVPSFGVHVNGFVPADEDNPMRLWVGVRSMSTATYPGKWDQIAAGRQPSGVGLRENTIKKCETGASIPTSISKGMESAGQVSYRCSTERGLSTKFLSVFDLQLPVDFKPYNGDGEVDEFILMTVEEALESVKRSLSRWKPNCALVMVDFALRHGFLSSDDEEYFELSHRLRTGYL